MAHSYLILLAIVFNVIRYSAYTRKPIPSMLFGILYKRAMMALDRSPESFSPQMNSTSLFLWFQLVTPWVGRVLIPRHIMWIKWTKFYKKMLHTENLSSIPSSFREEEFWSWSSLFLCSNLWPPGSGVSFDPKGIIWIKLIKVHKEMLNTKYQSSNPSNFREEEFWSWFSFFLCSNLWPPGWGQFWPHEHHMNKLGRGPQGDAKNQISKLYTPVSEEKNFEDGILCSYVPTCDPNLDPRTIIWTNLV